MLLQQPVQVLDQAAARRLLPESLPVKESVAGGGTVVRYLYAVQRRILLVELELGGDRGQVEPTGSERCTKCARLAHP